MAVLESGIVAAIIIPLAIVFAIIFVRLYQDRSDSEWLSSMFCVIGLSLVLISLSLVPIDIYLVSSTTDVRQGIKFDWATVGYMENIQKSVSIIYYSMFSLLSLFTFVLIPFAYFYYEEWDDGISRRERAYAASKFTLVGLIVLIVLVLMGYFVSVGEQPKLDFDWFKDLLKESNGERLLSFVIAVMAMLGLLLYSSYTAYGLAVWPIGILRGNQNVNSSTSGRSGGDLSGEIGGYGRNSSSNDAPQTTRRTIVNSSRNNESGSDQASTNASTRLLRSKYSLLGSNNANNNDNASNAGNAVAVGGSSLSLSLQAADVRRNCHNAFYKFSKPFRIVFGIIYLLLSISLALSIFLTAVDKAAHSLCGSSCGFVQSHPEVFNPLNSFFSALSLVFPVDYVFFCLIIVYLFFATIRGISAIGIRFLWVHLFSVRIGGTAPQGLLVTCIFSMLVLISLNFTLFYIAPQYVTFGGQTWINGTDTSPIKPCTIEAPNSVCYSTVISRVINKITVNRPVFGLATFALQWIFFLSFLISCLVATFKRKIYFSVPSDEDLDQDDDDDDDEEAGSRSFLDRFRSRR